MDPVLVGAIANIGYLATHEEAILDHVYAYVDFYEKLLFKGVINRPVELHSREFMIKQTDKKAAFQVEMMKQTKKL